MVNLIYCCSGKVCTCGGFCNFLPIYFSDSIVRKIARNFVQNSQITLGFLDFTSVDQGVKK